MIKLEIFPKCGTRINWWLLFKGYLINTVCTFIDWVWGQYSFLSDLRRVMYSETCNLTCTWRDILCWNRHGVGLHSVKHLENCQKGMKSNIGEDRKTDYTGVRLNRFYCICPSKISTNSAKNWDVKCTIMVSIMLNISFYV